MANFLHGRPSSRQFARAAACWSMTLAAFCWTPWCGLSIALNGPRPRRFTVSRRPTSPARQPAGDLRRRLRPCLPAGPRPSTGCRQGCLRDAALRPFTLASGASAARLGAGTSSLLRRRVIRGKAARTAREPMLCWPRTASGSGCATAKRLCSNVHQSTSSPLPASHCATVPLI